MGRNVTNSPGWIGGVSQRRCAARPFLWFLFMSPRGLCSLLVGKRGKHWIQAVSRAWVFDPSNYAHILKMTSSLWIPFITHTVISIVVLWILNHSILSCNCNPNSGLETELFNVRFGRSQWQNVQLCLVCTLLDSAGSYRTRHFSNIGLNWELLDMIFILVTVRLGLICRSNDRRD